MIKKILTSKWVRLVFSVGLIYLVFQKVDVLSVLRELKQVPWWFVVINVIYSFAVSALGAYRWSLLLFPNPGWQEVWNFVRASYFGGFYSLFFPSAVAGDLVKWVPLQKKYPELTKAKLFSSVVTDRVVGFTSYVMVALGATILGFCLNFKFPTYLLWLFVGLFVAVMGFYVIVFSFNVEDLISRIKFWKFHRLVEVANILKRESRDRLVKCLLVSVVSEIFWITPMWFISLVLGAGMSLLSVYIFVPVIGLVLTLPISVAGFGAREGLYLFFFGQLGLTAEKILAVSAFSGVLGILNTLLGGLLVLL